MSATRISRHVNAPPARTSTALLDARAVATWMVPTGMTSHVHEFDPREGGAFRISLTYDAPTGAGKTTAQTDTFHGRFQKLVPDEQVVEVVELETADPAMRGEMTITISLADADGGTEILAVHDGLPPGLSPADNGRAASRATVGEIKMKGSAGTATSGAAHARRRATDAGRAGSRARGPQTRSAGRGVRTRPEDPRGRRHREPGACRRVP